jgi:hypothetical protein
MHFRNYLYIMDLIITCISFKQIRLHVNCACVTVFVHQDSGLIESLTECQLFSSVCRLTVNSEE